MAHELDKTTGRYAFTWLEGEEAGWHQQQTKCIPTKKNQPINVWLHNAACDWETYQTPVQYQAADGTFRQYGDRVVLARRDTHAALEVVSDHYKDHQNLEMAEFCEKYIRENGLTLSTMGALRGGRGFFMSAIMPEKFIVDVNGDKLKPYLSIVTGHGDGKSTRMYFTSIRPVCQNTVNAGLSAEAGRIFKQRHSQIFDPQAFTDVLTASHVEMAERARIFNAMADRKLSNDAANKFFADLVGIDLADWDKTKKDGKPVIHQRTKNILATLQNAYTQAPGAIPGTAYGALQAVTYAVDHAFTVRDGDNDGQGLARIQSSQFGKGAEFKAKAIAALAKLSRVKLAA